MPPIGPKRILIIDDNPADRQLYRRLLDQQAPGAYSFAEAETGADGMERCLGEVPDCVLLDYNLPDMSGVEVLDDLVGEGSTPDVALVMITGQGDERVAVEAMKRGIHDYLIKGKVTGEALQCAMHSAMEKVALRAELEKKRLALIDSNRELERFACTVAHDLQNPLTSLVHAVRMIAEFEAGKLQEPSQKLLDAALQQTDRMRQLIRELLEFSRLDGKRQPFAPVDCNQLARQAEASLQAMIQEHGAEVRVGALPLVRGHPVQLAMVLENLIANAIKYRSDRPPVIEISAMPGEEQCEFAVSDNGVGIAPEFQEQVFEPLVRLHSYSEVPGTGLGLAICRKIVGYHGGRIWLQSTPGKGTVVRFTLPVVSE